MLVNPHSGNSKRAAYCNEQRVQIMPDDTPGELNKEQEDIAHMMSCRKNDCRRCGG